MIRNGNELEEAMAEYARLDCEIRAAQVRLEQAVQQLRERFHRETELQRRRRARIEEALRQYAETHKAQFRPGPKGQGRRRTVHGVTFGFRLSPPSVSIRNEQVTHWLYDAYGDRFTRVVLQPDREALKKGLENGDARLRRRLNLQGIRLNQADKFYIENRHPSG